MQRPPQGTGQPLGAVQGRNGGPPEPDRQPRRAQRRRGNARERTSEWSFVKTSRRRFTGWVQNGHGGGPRPCHGTWIHPHKPPGQQCDPNRRAKPFSGTKEPAHTLFMTEQRVRRMGWTGGMGPEAKALGKAQGSADGTPEESMAEVSSTSLTSVSNQVLPGRYDWADLPWPAVERNVDKLQRRIDRASQRHDQKKVHAWQRLLWRSWYARLLAVRRVTQDKQGQRTAGSAGSASLEPDDRLTVAQTLALEEPPQPVRRIWIPKPGRDEQRPLGIPTLGDHARPAWVLQVLEPEWEANLEPNRYGFRPGRSCHDASAALFLSIVRQPKTVLDADFSGMVLCNAELEIKPGLTKRPILSPIWASDRMRRPLASVGDKAGQLEFTGR